MHALSPVAEGMDPMIPCFVGFVLCRCFVGSCDVRLLAKGDDGATVCLLAGCLHGGRHCLRGGLVCMRVPQASYV